MNLGIVSNGSQHSFHICNRLNVFSSESLLEPCCNLSFSTHLPKPSFCQFSRKTQSGPYRTRPMEACAVSNLYVTTESFYDMMGVSESGTISEIKQAYKELARKYHPDVSPADCKEEYTKRFIQVQEAYETLSDPNRRDLYDRFIATGLPMAFSARDQLNYMEERSGKQCEWRHQWESQLAGLKQRSTNREKKENMSWAARMRMQRSEK